MTILNGTDYVNADFTGLGYADLFPEPIFTDMLAELQLWLDDFTDLADAASDSADAAAASAVAADASADAAALSAIAAAAEAAGKDV